jgi:hypothetical protein
MADNTYSIFISPILKKMNLKQVEKLLKSANKNDQIHERRKSTNSNNEMFRRAEELDSSFDKSKYQHLI